MLAGSLAGGVMALVNCPIELLKVRLQVQDSTTVRKVLFIGSCVDRLIGRGSIQIFWIVL